MKTMYIEYRNLPFLPWKYFWMESAVRKFVTQTLFQYEKFPVWIFRSCERGYYRTVLLCKPFAVDDPQWLQPLQFTNADDRYEVAVATAYLSSSFVNFSN